MPLTNVWSVFRASVHTRSLQISKKRMQYDALYWNTHPALLFTWFCLKLDFFTFEKSSQFQSIEHSTVCWVWKMWNEFEFSEVVPPLTQSRAWDLSSVFRLWTCLHILAQFPTITGFLKLISHPVSKQQGKHLQASSDVSGKGSVVRREKHFFKCIGHQKQACCFFSFQFENVHYIYYSWLFSSNEVNPHKSISWNIIFTIFPWTLDPIPKLCWVSPVNTEELRRCAYVAFHKSRIAWQAIFWILKNQFYSFMQWAVVAIYLISQQSLECCFNSLQVTKCEL